ncbi:hypothetical protein PR001_g26481 [Phytophthora rubi]|uniref:Uncharacterized protein n=1 Tax=Phytophthora rubi TaxID=129364 RepID=A0A6A3HY45_9STRA|nr:hypothetical protein PR001_g26481 [Phytophthora rubi]
MSEYNGHELRPFNYFPSRTIVRKLIPVRLDSELLALLDASGARQRRRAAVAVREAAARRLDALGAFHELDGRVGAFRLVVDHCRHVVQPQEVRPDDAIRIVVPADPVRHFGRRLHLHLHHCGRVWRCSQFKKVFDIFLGYFSSIEICVSEELGNVTIREDDNFAPGVTQNRLISSTLGGLRMESNTVYFSHYEEGGSEPGHEHGYGLFVADFVDEDAITRTSAFAENSALFLNSPPTRSSDVRVERRPRALQVAAARKGELRR